MSDYEVVLPTTTEEWQRDMNFAYNQALDDVMKIYNEMQPQLATNVYKFGERIKALKHFKEK